MQEAETPLQMGNRFEVSRLLCGMLPRLQPLMRGALRVAGGCQMMGEQFGVARDEIGEMRFQCRGDAPMPFLPLRAQQRAVGGVLHQRVLEQVGGMRSGAAAKQQSRIDQLSQRGLQFPLRTLRNRLDQFIGKLAAEHCADLRGLLGHRPEPVEPRH